MGSEVDMMASSSGVSFSMRLAGEGCARAPRIPLTKATPPRAVISNTDRRVMPMDARMIPSRLHGCDQTLLHRSGRF